MEQFLQTLADREKRTYVDSFLSRYASSLTEQGHNKQFITRNNIDYDIIFHLLIDLLAGIENYNILYNNCTKVNIVEIVQSLVNYKNLQIDNIEELTQILFEEGLQNKGQRIKIHNTNPQLGEYYIFDIISQKSENKSGKYYVNYKLTDIARQCVYSKYEYYEEYDINTSLTMIKQQIKKGNLDQAEYTINSVIYNLRSKRDEIDSIKNKLCEFKVSKVVSMYLNQMNDFFQKLKNELYSVEDIKTRIDSLINDVDNLEEKYFSSIEQIERMKEKILIISYEYSETVDYFSTSTRFFRDLQIKNLGKIEQLPPANITTILNMIKTNENIDFNLSVIASLISIKKVKVNDPLKMVTCLKINESKTISYDIIEEFYDVVEDLSELRQKYYMFYEMVKSIIQKEDTTLDHILKSNYLYYSERLDYLKEIIYAISVFNNKETGEDIVFLEKSVAKEINYFSPDMLLAFIDEKGCEEIANYKISWEIIEGDEKDIFSELSDSQDVKNNYFKYTNLRFKIKGVKE